MIAISPRAERHKLRVYYDTEFVENGSTIDLISIGMIREDGEMYYAVSDEFNLDAARAHPFVSKEVLPALDISENLWQSRASIAKQVSGFLKVPKVELWAWYGSYDHVCLAQLFGTMMDFPKHVPMWTNDLRQEVHRLGNPKLPEQTVGLHNALADACFLKTRAEFIREIAINTGDLVEAAGANRYSADLLNDIMTLVAKHATILETSNARLQKMTDKKLAKASVDNRRNSSQITRSRSPLP